MHVHRVNVALKCELPAACGPAEQQLTAASPWTTRRVQNHQLALPVSAVWRQAHQFTRPELVGEVAPSCGGTSAASLSHPCVMLPSVDIIFHRYTRQVIFALPHPGAPG